MIIVDKEEWKDINTKHDRDTVKKIVLNRIKEMDIPLPLHPPSLEEAKRDFNSLCDLDTKSMVKSGKWNTRYEYKHPLSELYIENSKIGGASSNYFHHTNRMKCDSINSPSPERVWATDKFMLTLMNFLWTSFVKNTDITEKTFATAISLRKYIASQYRPAVAKCIYDNFCVYNGDVLDISSGWGDRLAGFHASHCRSYTGIDPNINLHEGYKQQDLLYNTGKKTKFIVGQAENVKLDELYDMVFTSPPYFQIERYTKHNSQSYKKYKKIDEWLGGFLYPALDNAWNHLKIGGIMIINISDVYCYHKIQNICDPMNDFISTLDGAEYVGALGMRMAKRPNTKADISGIFCEPMWVYKKKDYHV